MLPGNGLTADAVVPCSCSISTNVTSVTDASFIIDDSPVTDAIPVQENTLFQVAVIEIYSKASDLCAYSLYIPELDVGPVFQIQSNPLSNPLTL